MTGILPCRLWLLCWKYISPLTIMLLLIGKLTQLSSEKLTYQAYVCGDPVSSFLFNFLLDFNVLLDLF